MSVKQIKSKVEKLKEKARRQAEPSPGQVAEAMKYYGETGSWPANVNPRARALAERMMTCAEAIMEAV